MAIGDAYLFPSPDAFLYDIHRSTLLCRLSWQTAGPGRGAWRLNALLFELSDHGLNETII